MGIRCYCPQGHKLNVKAEQAGKIGICPKCKVRFQIPFESTRQSHSHKSDSGAGPDAAAQPAPVPEQPAPEPADWYILGGDGREYGPVKKSVIKEWIAEHRVVGETVVWSRQTPKREAREIFPELGAASAPVPVPPVSAPAAEPAPAPVPADELDALRQAARDSQKSALQKRSGLNRKKKNRRDLLIVITLSVVIVFLLGILIALLAGGADKPEPAPPPNGHPAASASAEAAPPQQK